MNDFELDYHLGERGKADEESTAYRIAELMAKKVLTKFYAGDKPARRDAHPKSHGTVRATFKVNIDLPDTYAEGVFQAGREYKAWIRFSSGDGDARRADGEGDSHGMAIKLLGVAGDKLLPNERTATTQDFLLIDNPRFIIADPEDYLKLLKHTSEGGFINQLKAVNDLGLDGAELAREISKNRIADLLEREYFSTQAYRLGIGKDRTAVKYGIKPKVEDATHLPYKPGPNYLASRLREVVANGPIELDFLIQERTKESQSVETSLEQWTQHDSPFESVAKITIPKQAMYDELDAWGDNLSFTPWHSLPEHRPLGAVNRVRRIVYQQISTLRHQLNGTTRGPEPTENSLPPPPTP